MTSHPRNKIDRTEFAAKAAEGLTPAQLAEHFHAHPDTIWSIRRELGMSTRRKQAKINRQELLQLHEAGWTTNQLANHFGANVDSISRIKGQLGISTRHDITPERLTHVTQMIEDGWSYAEIHRTEGISYDSLRRYFPGRSWTQEQTTEYLRLRRQETRHHFNQHPGTYDPTKYQTQTHPVGATKHGQTRTHTLRAVRAAQDASQGRGRVIGHAA